MTVRLPFSRITGLAICLMASRCSSFLSAPHIDGSGESYALWVTVQVAHAERDYYRRFGTYAPLDEVLRNSPEQLAQGLRDISTFGYQVSLKVLESGFSLSTAPVDRDGKKASGRQSFYIDQTYIMRHSWLPDIASVASPELH